MSKNRVIITWGLITAVVEVVFYEVLNMSGNYGGGIQAISYLLLFGGLLGGMMQYRNKVGGGYAKFGELYKVGMMITLILAVISVIHLLIYLQIHPELPQKIHEQTEASMVNQGLPEDKIKVALSYADKFTTPTMLAVFGFVGNIIGGAIIGLLAAGISAKQKPIMMEDNNNMPS